MASILASCGFAITSLSGGSSGSRDIANEVLGGEVPCSDSLPTLHEAVILILGLPDDALSEGLAGLMRARPPDGSLVIHLSGLHGLEIYPDSWPEAIGAGAFHPLRSFPSHDPGARDLEGCLVAIEARAESDRSFLEGLGQRAGGQPVYLEPGRRPAWHLGAALMGNAVPALFDVALEAFRSAGVPEDLAKKGLANLSAKALENARKLGVAEALTGPVVRGDVHVLQQHLEVVSDLMPEKGPLYLELVRAQVQAASPWGDGTALERVRRWLEELQT